jgi:hypothetical protein
MNNEINYNSQENRLQQQKLIDIYGEARIRYSVVNQLPEVYFGVIKEGWNGIPKSGIRFYFSYKGKENKILFTPSLIFYYASINFYKQPVFSVPLFGFEVGGPFAMFGKGGQPIIYYKGIPLFPSNPHMLFYGTLFSWINTCIASKKFVLPWNYVYTTTAGAYYAARDLVLADILSLIPGLRKKILQKMYDEKTTEELIEMARKKNIKAVIAELERREIPATMKGELRALKEKIIHENFLTGLIFRRKKLRDNIEDAIKKLQECTNPDDVKEALAYLMLKVKVESPYGKEEMLKKIVDTFYKDDTFTNVYEYILSNLKNKLKDPSNWEKDLTDDFRALTTFWELKETLEEQYKALKEEKPLINKEKFNELSRKIENILKIGNIIAKLTKTKNELIELNESIKDIGRIKEKELIKIVKRLYENSIDVDYFIFSRDETIKHIKSISKEKDMTDKEDIIMNSLNKEFDDVKFAHTKILDQVKGNIKSDNKIANAMIKMIKERMEGSLEIIEKKKLTENRCKYLEESASILWLSSQINPNVEMDVYRNLIENAIGVYKILEKSRTARETGSIDNLLISYYYLKKNEEFIESVKEEKFEEKIKKQITKEMKKVTYYLKENAENVPNIVSYITSINSLPHIESMIDLLNKIVNEYKEKPAKYQKYIDQYQNYINDLTRIKTELTPSEVKEEPKKQPIKI